MFHKQLHLALQGSKTIDTCFVFNLYHSYFSYGPSIKHR